MTTKQFILYLISLIQLIYYYHNVNAINFEGAVGDKISKVIEIENPTNRKIHYIIKIEDAEMNREENEIIKKDNNNNGNTNNNDK